RLDNEDLRNKNETGREDAEGKRSTAENARVELYELVQSKLVEGEFNGRDLEFEWKGTELGVRVEGENAYEYVDLKGETGTLENIEASQIKNVLCFMPISSADIPDTS